jgi:two-component system, OmpR family, phosphate regulon response regulator PhoB
MAMDSTTLGSRTAQVLVVEDDAAIGELVRRALGPDQLAVRVETSGRDGLAALAQQRVDLVILDIGLPGMSGLDVLVELRRTSDIPVVLLTGRTDEADRIAGLDLGADDYVVKPFYPGELAARVRSLLRRSRPATAGRLELGDLEVDTDTREARVGGELIDLTTKEFDLLAFLARSPRRVFSREELLREVWQSSSAWQDPATVTEHVRRIRNKLESTSTSVMIATVRGVGYRIEEAV